MEIASDCVQVAKMCRKELEDALNEIRLLASLRHKNVVGFLEAFLEAQDSELCIVMEYCGYVQLVTGYSSPLLRVLLPPPRRRAHSHTHTNTSQVRRLGAKSRAL